MNDSEKLTEARLRSLLAERGYRLYERIVPAGPEHAASCQVFAVRGDQESYFLGEKEQLLAMRVGQFTATWGFQRLGLGIREYVAHAVSQIGEIILHGAHQPEVTLMPEVRERAEATLRDLLRELQEARLVTIHADLGKETEEREV
jgi:hypothetical protein